MTPLISHLKPESSATLMLKDTLNTVSSVLDNGQQQQQYTHHTFRYEQKKLIYEHTFRYKQKNTFRYKKKEYTQTFRYTLSDTSGVQIPPFQCLVSHYTDTHLYVFSLPLPLPLLINKFSKKRYIHRGTSGMCDKTDTKNKKTDKVYTMDTKHTLTNISRLGTGMNLPEPSTRNPDRIFFGYGWGGYDRCLGRRFEGDGNECDVSWITFQW